MHAPTKTQHSQINIHISFKSLLFIYMQESPLQESNLERRFSETPTNVLSSAINWKSPMVIWFHSTCSSPPPISIVWHYTHIVSWLMTWKSFHWQGCLPSHHTSLLPFLQDHTAMTEMTMFSHILAILDTTNPSKLEYISQQTPAATTAIDYSMGELQIQTEPSVFP